MKSVEILERIEREAESESDHKDKLDETKKKVINTRVMNFNNDMVPMNTKSITRAIKDIGYQNILEIKRFDR